MEIKSISKIYLNLIFKVKFHLKIKQAIKMHKQCIPSYKYGGDLFLSVYIPWIYSNWLF